MYISRRIKKKELDRYEGFIPSIYMTQLRAKRFYAEVISNVEGEQETVLAVYITDSVEDWLELVWVGYTEEILPIVRSRLLHHMIEVQKKRSGEKKKGIFFEIHADEVDDPAGFKHAMMMSGFETRETLDNIYELTLDQIREKEQKLLTKAAKLMKCIPVSKADKTLKEKLDTMIQEDSRPVPVGMYINWEDYLEEESLICMKDDEPCGCLLLSKKGGYIILECAYVTDKMALSSMIGWAYHLLKKKYGEAQKVLIPVVLEKTGFIVEKLAPSAVRGKMLEGIMFF